MSRPQWLPSRADLAGVALSALIGGVALGLGAILPRTPYLSDVLVALLLGALVVNTPLRRAIGLAVPGDEREPDRWAAGLRFVGKWVLRLGIILMGLKVQTKFFGLSELALIGGIAIVCVPSAFFFAHAIGARMNLRRPLSDLVAGGTMICGSSAVNALAPVVGARREEQGVAIATIFLFSVFALLVFRPVALFVGLDEVHAGLWSGLAVNDMSSAIAVGSQMGGDGGVLAAASKSARVLLLAPALVILALLRGGGAPRGIGKRVAAELPRFLLGYLFLAGLRAVGDRAWEGAPAWAAFVDADKLAVEVVMVTVAAGIGLHLEIRRLVSVAPRALVVGGLTSVFMASLTLGMIVLASRGEPTIATIVGGLSLALTFLGYRTGSTREAQADLVRRRFEEGAPLTLTESILLLEHLETGGTVDDVARRRVLTQLHPAIGELIPARQSPLVHGQGCRWVTYWEGKSGWALVALCREPGSATPIHAHPHRLIGKAIEGLIEELRFSEHETEHGHAAVELTSRRVLAHNELVETDGLATVHVVRVVGERVAIDLQLRGPESGQPGRKLRPKTAVDVVALQIGARIDVVHEADDRPGHGGEGAAAGRISGAQGG